MVNTGLKTYFLIFQPEDMFKLSLNFNEFQPLYACKCYACKKECISKWIQTAIAHGI